MKKLLIIASLLLCAAPAIAQDQCADTPDGGVCVPREDAPPDNLDPAVKRQVFLLGATHAMVESELEQKKQDPFFVVYPVDSGLKSDDTTVGIIETELCEDPNITQIMAHALNSPQGLVYMHQLGFTAIWCKGSKHGYKIYPAHEAKPKKPAKGKKQIPDGSI